MEQSSINSFNQPQRIRRSSCSFVYPVTSIKDSNPMNFNHTSSTKKNLLSPSPRIHQIKQEECLLQETNHERTTHLNLSLTHTWEDLALNDRASQKSNSLTSSVVSIKQDHNYDTGDHCCDSDSSDCYNKSPYYTKNSSPNLNAFDSNMLLQQNLPRNLRNTFKTISNPMSKTTRRSLSPIVVFRPSSLNLKRKYESDNDDSGNCSPTPFPQPSHQKLRASSLSLYSPSPLGIVAPISPNLTNFLPISPHSSISSWPSTGGTNIVPICRPEPHQNFSTTAPPSWDRFSTNNEDNYDRSSTNCEACFSSTESALNKTLITNSLRSDIVEICNCSTIPNYASPPLVVANCCTNNAFLYYTNNNNNNRRFSSSSSPSLIHHNIPTPCYGGLCSPPSPLPLRNSEFSTGFAMPCSTTLIHRLSSSKYRSSPNPSLSLPASPIPFNNDYSGSPISTSASTFSSLTRHFLATTTQEEEEAPPWDNRNNDGPTSSTNYVKRLAPPHPSFDIYEGGSLKKYKSSHSVPNPFLNRSRYSGTTGSLNSIDFPFKSSSIFNSFSQQQLRGNQNHRNQRSLRAESLISPLSFRGPPFLICDRKDSVDKNCANIIINPNNINRDHVLRKETPPEISNNLNSTHLIPSKLKEEEECDNDTSNVHHRNTLNQKILVPMETEDKLAS